MSLRFFIFISIILLSYKSHSQIDFYRIDSIREIRIYFYSNDWDKELDSLYIIGSKDRILADLKIDGVYLDSVGVRYKGFSSVAVNRVKNPFNIDLNYIKNSQHYNGIKKIKLSNNIYDPSFIREVLSYSICSNYLPSPKANFVNLFINDSLWGLYTNVEDVGNDFLNNHFGDPNNPFFKCDPKNINTSPVGENSNLSNTHGIDSLNYMSYYDIKSNYGWRALYALIDTLNNFSDSINNILNVDRTLWMHAINYTLINFDSYVGYSQNYYLYRSASGQFNPIIWDLNMSFGGFRLTDASSLFFNGFSISDAQNMDPLIHHKNFSISPRPLMRNLFNNSTYRKMYLAHIRTIVKENILNQDYISKAQSLYSLIDSSVINDTNKFYSNLDFHNNLTSQVQLTSGSCPGIQQLMDQRAIYLSSYNGFSGEPTISNVSIFPLNYNLGDDIWINAEVLNSNKVFLMFREGKNFKFKTKEMFDDGNNNDGLANDGIYGVKIFNCGNSIDYYIYAENDSAGVFLPARAAYEFFSVRKQVDINNIVINEIMSKNTSTASDNSGEFEDWIEIYNKSTFPINTNDLFITDNKSKLHKWRLPDITIKPNKYMIIWADDDVNQGDRHANFLLSSNGDEIYLSNIDSLVIDSVSYPSQISDESFARSPNGSGPFIVKPPTFNRNNDQPMSILKLNKDIFSYPNPFNKSLFLAKKYKVEVKDILGKLIYISSGTNKINTENWQKGMYFLYIYEENQTSKILKN